MQDNNAEASPETIDKEPDVLSFFTLQDNGFWTRDGKVRTGGPSPCNKKLCFTSLSVEPLAKILFELSQREDCWFVKLDSKPTRSGMIRGRCFLTNPAAIGALWLEYKGTETVLCTVQDDDFTAQFRKV